MECISNFNIAILQAWNTKTVLEIKIDNNILKLHFHKKKKQNKKDKNAYSEQNAFTKNLIKIPISRTFFFFSHNLTLAISSLK